MVLDYSCMFLAVKHSSQETAHLSCPPASHRRFGWVHGRGHEDGRYVSDE